MIVYTATKGRFQQDVLSNGIGDIIYDAYKGATGKSTKKSEINSWVNSFPKQERGGGGVAVMAIIAL